LLRGKFLCQSTGFLKLEAQRIETIIQRIRTQQMALTAGILTGNSCGCLRRCLDPMDHNSWLHCYSWDRYLSAARSHHDGEGESARWDPRGAGERDVYYWWGRFIEATFRHSLGPGAVHGISPRGRHKEVREPFSPPLLHGGCPGAPPSASCLIAMPGATQLTSP